jgi:hypothetical protein
MSEEKGVNANNNRKGIKECVAELSERLKGCKSEEEVLKKLKAEISEGIKREADKLVREIEAN